MEKGAARARNVRVGRVLGQRRVRNIMLVKPILDADEIEIRRHENARVRLKERRLS